MRERREDRRKGFSLIWLGLLIIIIFSGLFFSEIPNINTYISTKTAHNLLITKIKDSDTGLKYHKKYPEGIVISEGRGDADKVHAYIDNHGVIQFHTPNSALDDHKYIHIELKEEDNPVSFAHSIDNAAIYAASLMHQYNLKPNNANHTLKSKSEISKNKSDQMNPNEYFEHYGYNSNQFFNLIKQYYYGSLVKPPLGLSFLEELMIVLRIIAIIVGIVAIIAGLILPTKRWVIWWDK